jgi:tetratricopeptide (TPR) repeat protein
LLYITFRGMRNFGVFFLLLISSLTLGAQGLEDWYAVMSEWAGVDPNAGKATMWVLVIPPGGQMEGMGTAYTAVLKDSGYIEANPAGSALLPDTELSIYHNDYINETKIEGLVYTLRQGDLGLGFGAKILYLPFTGYDSWGEREVNNSLDAVSKGYYTESVFTFNASYNFFQDYYFDGLSLGASLKLAYRNVPELIYANQSGLGIMLDLGAVHRMNLLKFYYSSTKNLSLGLALRNMGPPVDGDPLPSAIVGGIAYSPIRPLTVSFDATLPVLFGDGFALENFTNLSLGDANAENPSFAVGMDLVLTNFWSIQSGIQLKTGRPRWSVGSTIAVEKMIFTINYTLDLATRPSAGFDRISVEAKLNLGDFGRGAAVDEARALYLEGLTYYTDGDYVTAIDLWEQSLRLNPEFTPAREIKEIAEKTLELQEEIQALGEIELEDEDTEN